LPQVLAKRGDAVYEAAEFPNSAMRRSRRYYLSSPGRVASRMAHHVDLKTGMYRGRQVLTPKESA
jgi:ribosomal protein L32